MSTDVELKALRWRCRRGMRELDQLLERWLDRCWAASSDADRETFRRLLATEDDKLWRAFLGHDRLDDDETQTLVERIATLAP
ncbi:succinate dehydrogenase assembly factor 2 family protein [Lysobacter sp. TY2-98]|uniref:FAD assembly factor SdhE n=1 Tax=Lysobacter sp. TY2-98 TaxID=2290922 RepID=UPI000E20BD81|nr:succinate dehydrogenase assembly factor 2 [Lysobacter sp. TY2-98]AXK71631.1 succinate dehydrogenase assembly factor 2 family protein [Lysobacter sp. TY2-98]